ncbi:hypothetical protein HYH03_014399 [Edaphochlamys debaryana]|uniref:Uncharacterized protein n=1 Tax=Edaphochlamys debaryana TaxID=47281 RepID=A0A835XNQ2_9CHLO|nr:hypothetical protein HYH03_014399 [Edaphochlamys debaryana]|eukprot:KAG2486899.1 hypothetical protein HYH03_014399 [Edaphochlamys debaryana]
MPRPGGLSPTPPRVRARRMSALDTAPWAAALPPRASWQGASLPSAPRGAGPSMGAAASGGASGAGGGGNGGGGGVARRASISLPDAVERPRGGLAKPTAARGPGPAACPDPYHSALVPPRTAAGGPHSCMAPPRTGGGGLQQSVEFTLPPAMPSASNGTGLPPAPNGRPMSRVLSDLKYRLRVFSASSRPNSPPKTTARSRANSVRRRASSHVEQPQQPAPHIHQPTLPPAPLSRANSTWIERLRANQVLSSTAAELAAAKAEAATEAAVPLGLLPDASEGGARSTRG